MPPDELYHLRHTDPAALARVLARYDAAGVEALAASYAAYVQQRDGFVLAVAFVVGAWQKAGLITAAQAGTQGRAAA
jgi:hypothetical protein